MKEGKRLMKTKVAIIRNLNEDKDFINEAGNIIKLGGTVAFPTETVYGLGADALNGEAVKKIFDTGDDKLTKIAVDIVYEGMAVWAAVQYLYQIGETHYASQLENMTERRQDVYGWGFTLYRDQYPLVKDSRLLKVTPFSVFPTLEPSRVTEFITSLLNNNENE